jgi:colanic acid biosynthesis glycosyl transferase WcaI
VANPKGVRFGIFISAVCLHRKGVTQKVRILALGINYWPDQTGIAPVTTGRCEYLASRGHQVTVCTGLPYYPQWRIADEYRGRLWLREVHNGVTILRTWMYVPGRVTSPRRIVHEASFVALSLLKVVFQRRPELLMVISPPLALGLVGALISRIWRIPYVFHVEDIQPDAAADLGMLGNSRMLNILERIAKLSYKRATLVSTLTEGMRHRIISKGLEPAKVAVFGHWAQPEFFAVAAPNGDERLRRDLGLQGRFIILHSGNIGVKQGLEVVLHAALRTRSQDAIAYLIVGDGAMRSALQEQARSMALNNVRFISVLPQDDYLELLGTADVCLVTQQSSVSDIVFPSKVVSLLAAGRPVVASVNGQSEVASVLREADAGLVVAPQNPDALAGAVRALHADEAGRTRFGMRGRTYAHERWNRERVLPRMEAQLLSLRAAAPIGAVNEWGPSPGR